MPPEFDTTTAHSARVYDFYLGGTDHFAVDRETGLKAMQSWPAVRTAVRENRAFLGRAVRYLAGEAGIRQFPDIGSGLPSTENVHEVALAVAPRSRVVYVDNGQAGIPAQARTAREFAALAFGGLDLAEPGVVLVSQWRPPASPRPAPAEVNWYGGVGRKP